eukprot:jgi/Botrbrau1/20730/Bobra.0058s0058.1
MIHLSSQFNCVNECDIDTSACVNDGTLGTCPQKQGPNDKIPGLCLSCMRPVWPQSFGHTCQKALCGRAFQNLIGSSATGTQSAAGIPCVLHAAAQIYAHYHYTVCMELRQTLLSCKTKLLLWASSGMLSPCGQNAEKTSINSRVLIDRRGNLGW